MREGIVGEKEATEKENGRTLTRNFSHFTSSFLFSPMTLLHDSIKELAGMNKQKQDILQGIVYACATGRLLTYLCENVEKLLVLYFGRGRGEQSFEFTFLYKEGLGPQGKNNLAKRAWRKWIRKKQRKKQLDRNKELSKELSFSFSQLCVCRQSSALFLDPESLNSHQTSELPRQLLLDLQCQNLRRCL